MTPGQARMLERGRPGPSSEVGWRRTDRRTGRGGDGRARALRRRVTL